MGLDNSNLSRVTSSFSWTPCHLVNAVGSLITRDSLHSYININVRTFMECVSKCMNEKKIILWLI